MNPMRRRSKRLGCAGSGDEGDGAVQATGLAH
jgi:hypothetical protein